MKKVAVGLSGGVDSAVVALLLKEQYEVTLVHMVCFLESGCREEQDKKDAILTALQLNLPIKILDFSKQYKEKVLSYFFETYKKGLTPNPDILCNSEIKFKLFLDWAISKNFDFIATGHYADIYFFKNNKNLKTLKIPKDIKKDQTYFLYKLNKNILDKVLFPLGKFTKQEVREIAKKNNLKVALKKDSTGICFVGKSLRSLLTEKFGIKKGVVLDPYGYNIGTHDGLWFYTIGQRSGFYIDKKKLKKSKLMQNKHNFPALYVIDKKKPNTLIVGLKEQVFKNKIYIKDLHFINENFKNIIFDKNIKKFVKIRNTQPIQEVLDIHFDKEKQGIFIKTKQKQWAIAPGQSTVLYIKDDMLNTYACIGGGTILNSPLDPSFS